MRHPYLDKDAISRTKAANINALDSEASGKDSNENIYSIFAEVGLLKAMFKVFGNYAKKWRRRVWATAHSCRGEPYLSKAKRRANTNKQK